MNPSLTLLLERAGNLESESGLLLLLFVLLVALLCLSLLERSETADPETELLLLCLVLDLTFALTHAASYRTVPRIPTGTCAPMKTAGVCRPGHVEQGRCRESAADLQDHPDRIRDGMVDGGKQEAQTRISQIVTNFADTRGAANEWGATEFRSGVQIYAGEGNNPHVKGQPEDYGSEQTLACIAGLRCYH